MSRGSMNTVRICAVCWQFADDDCIGGVTGNAMPIKHYAPEGATISVPRHEAKALQRQLRASIAQLDAALPRRSDNSKVSRPASVETKQDFERYGQGQLRRDARRGVDDYTPDHHKTGVLSIFDLVEIAGKQPDLLQRRDE